MPAPWHINPTQVFGVHIVTFVLFCVVFFISGLTLRTAEVKTLLRGRTAGGAIYGLVVSLPELILHCVECQLAVLH